LGVLRILIDKKLDLDLNDAVAFAVKLRCQGQGCRPGRAVLEFIFDRLRARYEDEGVDVATYLSVRALKPGSALDFDQRVQAVQAFRKLPEAAALAAVNKRVSNLLSKAEGSVPTVVEPSTSTMPTSSPVLGDPAGRPGRATDGRSASVQRIAGTPGRLARAGGCVLRSRDGQRRRRQGARQPLCLLARLRGLFLGVADISLLG
jgi:glycyl-tRNA synthetase beta chain